MGPCWCGQRVTPDGEHIITSGSFDIPDDWPYAYLRIEDEHGKTAWTNTLYTGQ